MGASALLFRKGEYPTEKDVDIYSLLSDYYKNNIHKYNYVLYILKTICYNLVR